jgi:peptide-methionine (S)-S-oxide reductase
MTNSDISDPLFRNAVQAIDEGNISLLQYLLESNPELISKRLESPTEGYFQFPYLLWFVADNPIRNERLPENIVDITRLLISFARKHATDSFQHQIDYTYGLVETGRIPRECGVQIELIDLLIDNGVKAGDAHGALAHGNIEAAKHIIGKSGNITLTAAVALDRMDDMKRLLPVQQWKTNRSPLWLQHFTGNQTFFHY